ncbi:DJ-1/PfpI family protein [candidate division KSB1 bacterium]|nr:DJ-1/PfpI family protein [candidate division KSB1 bacterium]
MKKILLLLADGFEIYEAAAFFDVIGWANEFGNTDIRIAIAGSHLNLKSTFGLRIEANILLEHVNPAMYDALAIPGGFETAGFYNDAFSAPFLKIINDFKHLNKPIASICVGALTLGKSGILRGKCATTYHLNNGKRRNQLSEMNVHVLDSPIVVDDDIITSTSPATAIQVAIKLLARLTTQENADHIYQLMGF